MIIGEYFRVSPPPDGGTERVLGIRRAKVVFQFDKKTASRRRMAGPFVEHATDMGSQWDRAQQVVGEQTFAALHVGLSERTP